MAKKISNPSKIIDKAAKRKWDSYKHIGSWKMTPYSMEGIKRLATEFIDWVQTSKFLYLERFWLERGIGTKTMQDMRARCPELEAAYAFGKEWMAMKREEAIHAKEADRETIGWRQPAYSYEVREVGEWKSSLRQKEAEKGSGNITVQMERYPDSPDVPLKPQGTD